MARKPMDLAGRTFGRLTAVEIAGRSSSGIMWRCKCECGGEHIVSRSNLSSGNVQSCGCLGVETYKHNARNTRRKTTVIIDGVQSRKHPLYHCWSSMRARCNNPNNKSYKFYGGRGIAVCERWSSFASFVEDMGTRPDGHTLERKDNDKGYSPDNCRWATMKEQCSNRRKRSA